jgi:SAM-dependent methyltransferase
MAKTKPFDEHLSEYEQWFADNHFAFESELEAIRKVIPKKGKGIEIGIGSGIFAVPLGITDGIEPSVIMREKARERGLHVIDGIAENLPISDGSYDFVLMVTTICFVDDLSRSFAEAHRILRHGGLLILGFVDKESTVGKLYLSMKEKSLFYRDALFYSTEEVYKNLWENNFTVSSTFQTVFGTLNEVVEIQKHENGHGKGSFVVVKAKKIAG